MHDKNGKPIKKGDRVLVEAVVHETYATEDFCNVQLHIGHDADNSAKNVWGTVTLNSAQTELIEPAENPAGNKETSGAPEAEKEAA